MIFWWRARRDSHLVSEAIDRESFTTTRGFHVFLPRRAAIVVRTLTYIFRDHPPSPAGGPRPKLRTAARDAKKKKGHAYVVVDDTLIPVVRVAADWQFYSGKHNKHKKHRMNLQVITSPRRPSRGCPARCPARYTIRGPGGCDTRSHAMSECADWRAGPCGSA